MPLKRNYKTKAPRVRKPKIAGGSKAGDWMKKASKFIKDKKLLSSGIKAAAPFLPSVGKPIAGFVSGVVDQLGWGVTLPGSSSQHGNGIVQTMPYKRVLRGTGLASNRVRGGGVLLPGQRAHTVKRQRIVKADVLDEQIGSGFHGNNRLY